MFFASFRLGLFIVTAACALAATFMPGSAATLWTTNGPYGGIVDQIVVDPTTPTTIYEASHGGGVFKSIDRGAHWTRQTIGLTNTLVYTLVIDPTNPQILYAAGGNGVFRTSNGAKTWATVNQLVNVRQLAINPKAPTTLYAVVSQSSLFKSTDSGKTWASQFNALPSQALYCIVIDPITPNNVYVGAQGGVWRTTNGGTSWGLVNSGLGSSTPFVQTLAINPKTPSILYAGAASGLKKSTNSGVSWAAVGAAPSSLTLLAIDPKQPTNLYGGVYPGQVYSSADSGAHWTQRPALAANFAGNLRAMAVDPTTNSRIYAGTDHGVFTSTTSAASWAESNVGLANTLVTTLGIDPNTPTTLYAGTEYSGIFKSTNGGGSWVRVYNDWLDKISSIQVNTVASKTLYASSSFGQGIFKSTDAGATWSNVMPSTIVLALAIDRGAPATLYAATGGGSSTVLKSVNSGGSWTPARTGLPAAGSLQANSLSALSGSVMLTDPSNGVYVSGNAGASWTANDPTEPSPAAMAPATQPVYNMAEGFLSAFLYAGLAKLQAKSAFGASVQYRVSQSPAAPASWMLWATPSGIDPSTFVPVEAIVGSKTVPSTFYAGGFGGVVKGTNAGASMAVLGAGLPTYQQVSSLALTPDGKTIHAGVYGGGVYNLTP